MQSLRHIVVNKVFFMFPAFASQPRWPRESPVETDSLQCEIWYGRDVGKEGIRRFLARTDIEVLV